MARRKTKLPARATAIARAPTASAWRLRALIVRRRLALLLADRVDESRRLVSLGDRRSFYTAGPGSPRDADPRWHRLGGDPDGRGPLTRAEEDELEELLGDVSARNVSDPGPRSATRSAP